MPTAPPQPAKSHIISGEGPSENAQLSTSRLPDEATSSRRRKWTFQEVAKLIKTRGLKAPLRGAGRAATPLFHRLDRNISRSTELKQAVSSSSETAHPLRDPASQSPRAGGSKERCVAVPLAKANVSPKQPTLEHAIPRAPVEASIFHASHTASSSNPTLDGPIPQSCGTDVQKLYPLQELVRTSSMMSSPKISTGASEMDAVSDAPISRNMTASEVVSHLVKHGVNDLSMGLDYSTFDEHPIVTGGSSDVYRGQLTSGQGVAVKVLRFSAQCFSESSWNIQDAARELHTWSKCNHPNVLPLFGLVTFRSRIGMVSPWMSEGTMPHYLKDKPVELRLKLCTQICEGLSYLHEKGIVHGDLKGTNVLVSEDGIPALTDFGNSTLKDQTIKFTQAASDSAFTVRWSAPEFVKGSGDSRRTKASDVYALGMTIYEALAGKIPYYGETELQVIISVAMKKTLPVRPGSIPSGHRTGDKLWELLAHCWSWEPETRPSAPEVTSLVSKIHSGISVLNIVAPIW